MTYDVDPLTSSKWRLSPKWQSLCELHARFIRERNYLDNVSPRTIRFFKQSWGSLTRLLPEVQTLDDLRNMVNGGDFVIALRQSGVKPVSCNTYIRGVNCFLSWLHASGLLEPKLAIKQLRVEKTIPKILDGSALSRLIGYKPACMSQRRVHAIALMVIDAGLRISEVISLRAADIDMDTMVLRVMGKGRKERMMPFSPELRRVLFRYMESYPQLSGGYVFGSEGRSMPGYRNLLRDYHLMLSNIASTVWVGFIGSVILSLVPICSGAAINSIFNECSGTRT